MRYNKKRAEAFTARVKVIRRKVFIAAQGNDSFGGVANH